MKWELEQQHTSIVTKETPSKHSRNMSISSPENHDMFCSTFFYQQLTNAWTEIFISNLSWNEKIDDIITWKPFYKKWLCEKKIVDTENETVTIGVDMLVTS